MKQLMFSLAFMLIGSFAFANNESIVFTDSNSEKNLLVELNDYDIQLDCETLACSSWITVNPPSGNTYYLCADNYSNMSELIAAVEYFNSMK